MYLSSGVIGALIGLTAAIPHPQRINIGAAEELALPSILGPELAAVSAPPSSYNPTSAASAAAAAIPTQPIAIDKRSKRAACQLQPDG